MTADSRVTVVIVTRDRAESLDRTLSALTQLPERPPVIVVDNGSTDGTAEPAFSDMTAKLRRVIIAARFSPSDQATPTDA